ncbi:tetratricopeptide repeat protein [Vulcaniibacterium thermophilum]|uniref:OmpR/PhoB-type domain-containing protein n=2 Tax=Gammaproteobacteria TaxID=1236 RepID=A0A918YU62_9GAMM|nr:tetratricopeptide repeat protein [Vulcaniibacterium thermophilum]GHE25038.1 hypothetical protein GCM10007167_01240 [Vulcaniibacterium thermophilum]
MTANGRAAAEPAPGRYRFDGFVVDVAAHTLTRDGVAVTVEPKAFAVLAVLLVRAGELVGRDELLDAVWGHRHVTPGVLTRVIAQLRHALGDDAHHPRYIQTQHALGYRFVGTLQTEQPARAAAPIATRAAEPVAVADGPSASVPAALPSPRRRGGEPPARMRPRARRSVRLAALVLALPALLLVWNARQPPATPTVAPSVAVLPFTPIGRDEADRYFAEGLAAEMHDALAGVPGLKVAAWLPATAGRADPRALGQRLGVAAVLDASVQREGQRVRIRARLTDTATGFTLWSRRYDRELGDVFATQSEIAREVASALVGVLPDAGEGLRRRLAPTRDVAAFDAYLRGLHALASGGDRPAAGVYFRRALAQDAGFARAQAGLCRVEAWRFETQRNAAAFDGARLACRTAENMDPGIPDVQLALGDLYRVRGDLDRAAEQYRRIVEDPAQRASALVGLAKVEAARGRPDAALALFRQALRASPSDARIHAEMGYRLYLANRLDEAVAALKRATELRPDSAEHWGLLGALLLTAGSNEAAMRALERAAAIEPDAGVLSNLGTLKYQGGDYAGAAALYRRAARLSPGNHQLLGNLGDALLADPATAAQARDAFREAAELAQRYVELKPEDAKALAALGWYRANLGQREAAVALARRAEALGGEPAEVAFYNAETFALLGDRDAARARLQAARAAGLAETRLTTHPLFARAGLLERPPAAVRGADLTAGLHQEKTP